MRDIACWNRWNRAGEDVQQKTCRNIHKLLKTVVSILHYSGLDFKPDRNHYRV
jgi:hypothetical protein